MMTVAPLALPVCAHLAECVGAHCSWWSLCCVKVCHAVRSGTCFVEMLLRCWRERC